MSFPSTVEGLPFYVKTLGKFWMDPRMLVGTGMPYETKEDIPTDEIGNGMWTWTVDGKLWVRIADAWVDIFSLYILATSINQPGGVAGIDQGTGKIDASLIPDRAITNVTPVNSEAEMLALVAQTGEVAIRQDQSDQAYILIDGGDPTVLADWATLSFGVGVTSVNGKTGVVTITADDIAETASRKWVSPTEKNTWNSKQDALGFDSVPTVNSTKWINSGDLFDYLKTIQSSVNNKSWAGSEADGNNRFNLDAEDEDIDQVIIVTEGGVVNQEGVHFSIDAAKRYVEWSTAPDTSKTYYLKYLSNIPVVSLTSVAVANVEGLLVDGKVDESLLPDGVGGPVEVAFSTALKFDKDYVMNHNVSAAIAFTLNAGAPETNDEAKKAKKTLIFLKANGINKPTFSSDFFIYSDNWDNTNNMWNRIFLEYQPGGKVLVDITYTHSA